MFNKKSVLQRLLIFIFIAGILTASSTTILLSRAALAADPSHITLTWDGDTRTTQTITWKTDSDTQEGMVEYWEDIPGKTGQKNILTALVESVDSNCGTFLVHTATLTGLKPGTHYLYRVGSAEKWSAPHPFTTAPATPHPYRFLVFGDSQSVNYDTWRTTLHQACLRNADAAFFINMGDLVDVGQDYGQWAAWFTAAQGVLEKIPCMPIVGNHETYAPGARFARPTLFTAQFKLPMNGPEGLKGQVYSFNYGDVHFVMLDSQLGEEENFVTDMLEKQKKWLESDLAAAQQKWKLVFVHRALYNNKARSNAAIQAGFAPILDKYHADVVFTAHDHVYARTYPLYGGTAVASPAEGTIYVATGRSGSKTYVDSIAKEWDSFFYNPLGEPNYLSVNVVGNLLIVQAFRQNGELIDEWNIAKK